MRGLFFIVKGQYKRDNDEVSISGYDPYDPQTNEWYMLMGTKTFHCISCGSDYNRVLKGVYTVIKKYKGVAKNYFRYVSKVTSDDYYEVTYLGHRPLNDAERAKKAVGRCPRVSPKMREIYTKVYNTFGDFFEDDIKEMEERAYEDLKDQKPFRKSQKLIRKTTPNTKVSLVTPPKKEEVINTSTPKKLVKKKVKLGIKKLNMEY